MSCLSFAHRKSGANRFDNLIGTRLALDSRLRKAPHAAVREFTSFYVVNLLARFVGLMQ
jgi:hypothetical protein